MHPPRAVMVLICLAVLGVVAPATAGPADGAFTSGNVEFIDHVPLAYDASGGRIVGDRFLMTTARDLRIYDISEPAVPALMGTLPLPQEPQFVEEDLDTNGRIALVESFGTLSVIDVTDGTDPHVVGTLSVPDFHTVTCILDCTFAYAAEGHIIDLRDPTAPVLVGDWRIGTPATAAAHDVTEVAPGLVVTSSRPIMLLDARTDPTAPAVIAVGQMPDNRFIHANRWPRGMQDRFLLVGGETTGPRCDTATAGAFMVWDTEGWQDTGRFTMLDEYRVTAGPPTAGRWPYGQFCGHWFAEHPTFRDGGLVAMAWYEYGVRFLDVGSDGTITEAGWAITPGSVASAAYWASDDIVYVVDFTRGFDILRFTGPIGLPATEFEASAGTRWTSHFGEIDLLERVAAASPRVAVETIGETLQGLPLHLVRIGHPAPRDEARARAGPVLLIICTQHGNEPAGREACLGWIRDLAFTDDPGLLEQLSRQTILVVPTVNPDGRDANDRENTAGTDINRDHLTVTSPEARAIGRVIRDHRPSMMLDLHEYGPSTPVLYDDDVLYLWGRNLNIDPAVRDLGREFSQEHLAPCLAEQGYTADEYGLQAAGDVDVEQTAGDGDEGIARNTAGLRHAVGILIESAVSPRAADPSEAIDGGENMRRRVASQHATIACTLAFMRAHGDRVRATSLASRGAAATDDKPVYFDGQDEDTTLTGSRDTPTSTADPAPCAYRLTPKQAHRAKVALDVHGISSVRAGTTAYVGLEQDAEPVIPLLLDARGARHAVDADPLQTCPTALTREAEVLGARQELPATGLGAHLPLGLLIVACATAVARALVVAR